MEKHGLFKVKRRKFIQQTATIGVVLGTAPIFSYSDKKMPYTFKLNYASHIDMFAAHAGKDPLDQLNFMADQGFTAFEDNEMRSRPISTQKAMAKVMVDRGIRMGVFVAHKIYWSEPSLTSGDKEKREEFLADIKTSIDVAKRVNAKWMTVVPGSADLKKDKGYQDAHAIDVLKRAADMLESHGLVMVLEPLNFRDHPGLFLTKAAQAYKICKAVNSPSCKILFDIYHQQVQEGNLIPNIEACWNEIDYFQIGDNPGRNEPGTGEINYANVFKYIRERGFNGILGMEHHNSMKGKKGEQAVIDAYRKVDNL